jgi:hypothetical protein
MKHVRFTRKKPEVREIPADNEGYTASDANDGPPVIRKFTHPVRQALPGAARALDVREVFSSLLPDTKAMLRTHACIFNVYAKTGASYTPSWNEAAMKRNMLRHYIICLCKGSVENFDEKKLRAVLNKIPYSVKDSKDL